MYRVEKNKNDAKALKTEKRLARQNMRSDS